ncbi:NB-ARC domains-containing protein [Tanacetum coccineum]
MHDLIQAMAWEIVREESNMPGNRSRLWDNPSEIYNILSEKKATQAVEILDILEMKSSQKFDIDGKAFAQMKNLRILKLPKNNAENIVVIDLSYSHIKQFWTAPKCLRRLKVMKLRYCCSLTTTPDFSEITSLEVLDLEGCVNLVTVHPSIGMLNRLVLNMRDCRRATNFPSKVEMDSLQVLNLLGCLNVDQPPEAFWSRWWTFGLLSKRHPPRLVSLAGFHMLKSLNFTYCNLEQVPESIGGLSCLEELYLEGNNFSSLPGSLSQLSHLKHLYVDGCKKLEVLPELPPSLSIVSARDCTSLCSITGSSKHPIKISDLNNCSKMFTNLASSITSHGFPSYWKEVKNFVTFGSEDEDIEVKEMGVRLVCDEDLNQVDLSMLQDLPTLSPHGGMISLSGRGVWIPWSW